MAEVALRRYLPAASMLTDLQLAAARSPSLRGTEHVLLLTPSQQAKFSLLHEGSQRYLREGLHENQGHGETKLSSLVTARPESPWRRHLSMGSPGASSRGGAPHCFLSPRPPRVSSRDADLVQENRAARLRASSSLQTSGNLCPGWSCWNLRQKFEAAAPPAAKDNFERFKAAAVAQNADSRQKRKQAREEEAANAAKKVAAKEEKKVAARNKRKQAIAEFKKLKAAHVEKKERIEARKALAKAEARRNRDATRYWPPREVAVTKMAEALSGSCRGF